MAASRRDRDSNSKHDGRRHRHYASEETTEDLLKTHYCRCCGQFSLILDTTVEQLPQRQSDNARVIDQSKRTFKVLMAEGETKFIRRAEGLEKQQRFNCSGCGLVLAYRSDPAPEAPPCLYVLEGAVTVDLAEALQQRAQAGGDQ